MNYKLPAGSQPDRTISRKRIAVALAAAVIAGSSVVMAGRPTANATVTYDLDYTGTPVTRTWDSGKTKNLSSYSSALCPANYGGERLVVKFVGHREPSSNLDNFIARLSAICRRYEADGSLPYAVADNPPDDDTKLLYSEDYKSGAMATEVEVGGNGDRVPVGVRLTVNTNEYVKDIQMLYRISTVNGLGSLQTASEMTGLSGDTVDRECPANYAMTGVRVKYSTDSGKLRVFQVECHRLVH